MCRVLVQFIYNAHRANVHRMKPFVMVNPFFFDK
jgi:hypothetical protein